MNEEKLVEELAKYKTSPVEFLGVHGNLYSGIEKTLSSIDTAYMPQHFNNHEIAEVKLDSGDVYQISSNRDRMDLDEATRELLSATDLLNNPDMDTEDFEKKFGIKTFEKAFFEEDSLGSNYSLITKVN